METKVSAGMAAIMAVAETIRELGSVPSGELYARLMGSISLESYGQIVGTLERAGLIEERGHLLRWVGPIFDGGRSK